VQRICDRVAIIKEGRIISTRKIAELQNDACKKVSFVPRAVMSEFALEGASDIEISDGGVSFVYKGSLNRLLAALSGYDLLNLDISEPDLEEIFMHYYE